MTTPSKVTSPPRSRKSKSIPVVPNVVANIVFIPPYLRKLQEYKDWNIAIRAYVNTLSNDEQILVKKCVAFICAKPEYREHLHGPCPLIQFPVGGKRGVQVAKEA